MRKRLILLVGAITLCLVLAGFMWMRSLTHLGSQVRIKFVALTNNSAGLLGGSDKILAVFSVTNGTSSPIEATSFYYIETSGYWSSYAPLGSAGPIAPHGYGTILTRIPTNSAPWRVIVPYFRSTLTTEISRTLGDGLETALKRPRYGFERYGKGAPTSDWIKP
jgi:hypothetical protein